MKKRAVSLLLAISMMIGLLSVGIAAGSQFADDDGSGNWSWASDYIYACSDAGIINGYTDNTFLIDNNLTRVEAAAIIARAYGLTTDADESTFSDVSSDHWGLQYIEACVEAGIINGYEDGTFRPDNNVTRAEMAKMIAVSAALAASGSACFRDDDGSGNWAWASEYIYACYEAGILNGYTNGDFLPANSITRGEASKMIAIAVGLAEGTAVTDGQLEALSAAEVFLETYCTSFDDLVTYLTEEEGYTQNEAVYAAVNCGADWNEEALWTAEYLLEYYIFSETSLKAALIDDCYFTSSQAAYALSNLDVDWNEEAVYGAMYCLNEDPFLSYDELVAMLIEEMGYTASQAAYGANAVGVYQESDDPGTIMVQGVSYTIGQSVDTLGTPDETTASVYGFTWYFFNTDDYNGFFAAGVENGVVVALIAGGPGFSYQGYYVGYQLDDYTTGSYSVLIATDSNYYNIVHAVRIMDKYRSITNTSADALYGESRMIFHLTNAYRVCYGLDPLIWSDAAAEAARLHSEDMANQYYYSHDSLDGTSFTERMEAQGIDWSSAGENIDAGYEDGFSAYDGWVNSAGHRSNMLSDNYTYLGVGGGYNAYYWGLFFTQDFYS